MLCDFAEPRTAETIWRTEPAGLLPSCVVDGFAAALKFLAGFVGSAEEKIRMSLRVITQEVAARGGFFRECRTLGDEFSDQEKGGLGVVFSEEIEKFRGDGGIGPIVKRERKEFGRGRIANRWTEELGTSVRGSVGGEAGESRRDRRGNCNRPWVHESLFLHARRRAAIWLDLQTNLLRARASNFMSHLVAKTLAEEFHETVLARSTSTSSAAIESR